MSRFLKSSNWDRTTLLDNPLDIKKIHVRKYMSYKNLNELVVINDQLGDERDRQCLFDIFLRYPEVKKKVKEYLQDRSIGLNFLDRLLQQIGIKLDGRSVLRVRVITDEAIRNVIKKKYSSVPQEEGRELLINIIIKIFKSEIKCADLVERVVRPHVALSSRAHNYIHGDLRERLIVQGFVDIVIEYINNCSELKYLDVVGKTAREDRLSPFLESVYDMTRLHLNFRLANIEDNGAKYTTVQLMLALRLLDVKTPWTEVNQDILTSRELADLEGIFQVVTSVIGNRELLLRSLRFNVSREVALYHLRQVHGIICGSNSDYDLKEITTFKDKVNLALVNNLAGRRISLIASLKWIYENKTSMVAVAPSGRLSGGSEISTSLYNDCTNLLQSCYNSLVRNINSDSIFDNFHELISNYQLEGRVSNLTALEELLLGLSYNDGVLSVPWVSFTHEREMKLPEDDKLHKKREELTKEMNDQDDPINKMLGYDQYDGFSSYIPGLQDAIRGLPPLKPLFEITKKSFKVPSALTEYFSEVLISKRYTTDPLLFILLNTDYDDNVGFVKRATDRLILSDWDLSNIKPNQIVDLPSIFFDGSFDQLVTIYIELDRIWQSRFGFSEPKVFSFWLKELFPYIRNASGLITNRTLIKQLFSNYVNESVSLWKQKQGAISLYSPQIKTNFKKHQIYNNAFKLVSEITSSNIIIATVANKLHNWFTTLVSKSTESGLAIEFNQTTRRVRNEITAQVFLQMVTVLKIMDLKSALNLVALLKMSDLMIEADLLTRGGFKEINSDN